MKRIVRFTLNNRKFGSQTTVEGVHQGDDNSCELVITITNGNKTLDLSSETTIATMCGVKPDGTKISRPCAIVNNNIVYTLEKQDTADSGNVLYQVVVSTDNGISQDLTATAKFTVAVMKNIDIPIYRVLESEPTDWSTNYTAYYRLLDNKYTAISDNNCPAFLSDTFYYLINPNYESKDDYGAFHSALVRVENLIGRASDILTILDSKINYTDVYTQAEVDTALADKADTEDVYSINEADEMFLSKWEAEQDYVKNISLENKADKNSVYTKTEVDTAIANKADTSDVDRFLLEKENLENKVSDITNITNREANYPSIAFLEDYYYNADEIDALLNGKDISTNIESALAEKADKAEVENSLAEKADKTEVEESLSDKADRTDVENALAQKVEQTDFENTIGGITDILFEKANIADVYEIIPVKNVLNISPYTNTINGITVTVDANNHLTISGTASKYTLIQDIPVNCILETGANYTLSTQNSAKLGTNDTSVSIALGGHTSSSTLTINYEGQDTSKTFTAETNNVEFLWLQVASGKIVNVECYIQLEKGEEYTEFIPPNAVEGYISKLSLRDGSVSKEKLSEELQSKTNLLPKMNYIYVSNSFTNADEGFGLTKFNSILAANNSITDNSEFNRYTIIVKAGTYNEFEETYSGSTDTEKLQGIETKNYVYYESENINNPSECVLSWDGSVGYEEGTLTDAMAIKKCIFHIKGGGYLEEGMHTHIKGFTITSKNTRYGLHIESGGYGRNVDWLVENCIIEYGGRPFIAGSELQPVLGMGMSPFECGEIRKCVIKYSDDTTWNSDTDTPKAIVCHNNSDTTIYTNKPPVIAGAELNIKDCKFNDNTVTFSTKPNTVLSDTKFTVHLDNNVGISSVDNSEAWLLTDGANSYTPVKGVDYFTEEDKAELVEAVYALIADGNEVAY